MAKSKYVLTEKQIIKRISEGRGAGRLSGYKPWLYVNEVPSEGRSQRVYSHLTGRIHHVLSDLEFAVFLLLDHSPAVTDIREQFPFNRDDTLNISKDGQLWHPSQGGGNLVCNGLMIPDTKLGGKVSTINEVLHDKTTTTYIFC